MRENYSDSGNAARWTLNQEVAEFFKNNPDTTDSISLRMKKFVLSKKDGKFDEWQKICDCANGKRLKPRSPLPGALGFTAALRGRMMVDHNGDVLNASLNIHRFFGFPMIPGSALKGISRHMARQAVINGELEQADFLRVWGSEPGRQREEEEICAGTVAFLAAEPVDEKWKLVVDILNNHNDCDTKNPIPVFFPAVERGARFAFSVYPLKSSAAQAGDAELALKYLKLALSENGVGAKTAAGYGWFEIEVVEDDETFISKLSCLEYTSYLEKIASWSN
ncbi:MAG: type III-B CRISPR module RAMP protein Cmr6, partial [Victivallaceae bacterium]